MTRNIGRRIGLLETSIARASRNTFFSARILLVNPQDGLTGVLLIETDKPTTRVPATPEEVASVRERLERRRGYTRPQTRSRIDRPRMRSIM